MRSALVVGSDGMIGGALSDELEFRGWRVLRTTRRQSSKRLFLDVRYPLLAQGIQRLGPVDVTFFCAGVARFVDCESDPSSYTVNVDAPLAMARTLKTGLFVFLSSDAVQKALHTNYGMHKALAEIGLLALPNTAVVRLGRVERFMLKHVCARLCEIGAAGIAGLYHWTCTEAMMNDDDTSPISAR